MLNSEIDAVDFRTVKIETSEKITRLESRLGEINNKNNEILDIKSIAEQAFINLKNLDIFFDNADAEGKRYLISCIFPEKIVYDGDRHRTTFVNELASHIYLKNKELEGKKKVQSLQKRLWTNRGG